MLFALGSNGSGQLGISHVDDVSKPALVEILVHGQPTSNPFREIKRIAAGGNHTLFLTNTGTVFVSGNNEDGRCGTSDIAGATRPSMLPSWQQSSQHDLERIVDVSATWSASIFLTEAGSVISCGSGDHGELGLGEGVTEAKSLKQIPAFPPEGTKVVSLSSCMAHTVAVLDNGEAWGWGGGRIGRLGEPVRDVWRPRKISELRFKAVKAVCGKDFTCIIGLPDQGELLVLAPRRHDRFQIREGAPEAVPGWMDISASWNSVFVLMKDGSLIAWGRNDHGQLPRSKLPSIKAIAAGSEHCVALDQNNRIMIWGWGEHGNCGTPIDDRGDVKDRWNEFQIEAEVRNVFAGCATTFFSTVNR